MSSRHILHRLAKNVFHHLELRQALHRNRLSTSSHFNRLSLRIQYPLNQFAHISPLYSSNQLLQLELWRIFSRNYAKGKDKKKSDKGKKNVVVDESQLRDLINLDSLKKQMQKPIDLMKEEYVKNLSLRSTTVPGDLFKLKMPPGTGEKMLLIHPD